MDPKSTVKITNKDIDKLEKEYARGKISIKGIAKEQEAVIALAEKTLGEVKKKLILAKKSLEPYSKGKDLDSDFFTLKEKYERLLVQREQLEKTIQVAMESVESAKLNLI